ncbi:MAG: hypothetical protein QJR08_04215 [Bacillota bacterium]|nr:hypothetical protein [Bacillota bacterium]
MPERMTDEQLEKWESDAKRLLPLTLYMAGILWDEDVEEDFPDKDVPDDDELIRLISICGNRLCELVAEVRQLRDLIRRMAAELEERQLSQPLYPEIYAALGLDWEEHVGALTDD